VARCRYFLQRRLDAAHNELGEVHKGKMEMTIDGHDRGLEKIHNKRREDAKEVGRNMNQEEFDREFTKVKERL
jgi:hypothetical protein